MSRYRFEAEADPKEAMRLRRIEALARGRLKALANRKAKLAGGNTPPVAGPTTASLNEFLFEDKKKEGFVSKYKKNQKAKYEATKEEIRKGLNKEKNKQLSEFLFEDEELRKEINKDAKIGAIVNGIIGTAGGGYLAGSRGKTLKQKLGYGALGAVGGGALGAGAGHTESAAYAALRGLNKRKKAEDKAKLANKQLSEFMNSMVTLGEIVMAEGVEVAKEGLINKMKKKWAKAKEENAQRHLARAEARKMLKSAGGGGAMEMFK